MCLNILLRIMLDKLVILVINLSYKMIIHNIDIKPVKPFKTS